MEKYVFLRREMPLEIEKYCGEKILSHKNDAGKILEIYKRNNVEIQKEHERNVCPYCGTVSNFFTQDYREIDGTTSKHVYCIACFNMSDSEFYGDMKEGIENIIKDLSNEKK